MNRLSILVLVVGLTAFACKKSAEGGSSTNGNPVQPDPGSTTTTMTYSIPLKGTNEVPATSGAEASANGTATIALHWLMLVLLAAVYACIELRELWPRGSDPRELIKTWHYMLGLSVLALAVLRILARISGGTPPITPRPAAWQNKNAPVRSISITIFHLSSGISSAGVPHVTPALLMRMSILPKASIVLSTAF